MTRLPRKRGITRAEEDTSLILRQFHSLQLNLLFAESHLYLGPLPGL